METSDDNSSFLTDRDLLSSLAAAEGEYLAKMVLEAELPSELSPSPIPPGSSCSSNENVILGAAEPALTDLLRVADLATDAASFATASPLPSLPSPPPAPTDAAFLNTAVVKTHSVTDTADEPHESTFAPAAAESGKRKRITASGGALQAARDAAESFALQEVAATKKAKGGDPGSPGINNSSDEGLAGNPSAKATKYARRLQKNRDSAYVSRIRRRKYTGLLEESLSKEEEARLLAEEKVHALQQELARAQMERNVLATAVEAGRNGSPLMDNFVGPMVAMMKTAMAPVASNTSASAGVTSMFMLVFLLGAFVPGMMMIGGAGAVTGATPGELGSSEQILPAPGVGLGPSPAGDWAGTTAREKPVVDRSSEGKVWASVEDHDRFIDEATDAMDEPLCDEGTERKDGSPLKSPTAGLKRMVEAFSQALRLHSTQSRDPLTN